MFRELMIASLLKSDDVLISHACFWGPGIEVACVTSNVPVYMQARPVLGG
ncbi:MAG: hypothetical protein ABEJ58_05930 [Halodesulfurarchaeum sp.]